MGHSRHQCLIYDGPPERQLPGLARLAFSKLKSNHRCLYMNSPEFVSAMAAALTSAGIDVAEEVERGALILTSDQSHLVHGQFDVSRMLDVLTQSVEKALADGYAGLWASGDMSWELGNEHNAAKLLAYEYGLEEVFESNPGLSGICQYHRDSLPEHATQDALSTHRNVYLNETLSRLNPYYRPFSEMAYPRLPIPGMQIEQMLANLY